LRATLLFHLNLDYSAIEVEERPEVVRRCYRPLLGLCDALPWLVLALEAPVRTLEAIGAIDPDWLGSLCSLVERGRIELVGSGDTQLIGPLVPAPVNAWNQRLGMLGYEELLGFRPRTALVGEMAFSQGLVDAYLDAGYETLVMEWNNARRWHPEWESSWRYETAWTRSPGGRRVRLVWVDSVLFQKFQRCVMGELTLADYRAWAASERGPSPRHVFLHAGDAEVFGFRPGRYASEPPIEEDEWARMARVLEALEQSGVRFTTPSELVRQPAFEPRRELFPCTAADPIPVKKQPKYNVTRWALTGRDDLGLNSACHAQARRLEALQEQGMASPEDWRELCRAWSSDLRTHITETRWESLRSPASWKHAVAATGKPTSSDPIEAEVLRGETFLTVATGGVKAVLNMRRGLALEALQFTRASARPLLGTLHQGAFDPIDWAADFYSGHTVLEVPAHRRVTDLERCAPIVVRELDNVALTVQVPTQLGPLAKTVRIYEAAVELDYGFSAWGPRPLGTLRTGFVTLLSDAWGDDLFVTAASGGAPERMPVTGAFDHGASVSALVSESTGFGATDGRLALDDGRVECLLEWHPELCAAVPLLAHRMIGGRRFCRVAFSLGEIDETLVGGAPLLDFAFRLSACTIRSGGSR